MEDARMPAQTPVPVVLVGAHGHGRWHLRNLDRLARAGAPCGWPASATPGRRRATSPASSATSGGGTPDDLLDASAGRHDRLHADPHPRRARADRGGGRLARPAREATHADPRRVRPAARRPAPAPGAPARSASRASAPRAPPRPRPHRPAARSARSSVSVPPARGSGTPRTTPVPPGPAGAPSAASPSSTAR